MTRPAVAPPENLAALQREMASAIMQPLTPHDGMRERAADGRAMSDIAASFIAPNSRLTAFERLEIYNRQYWYRVLNALADDFPALRALVGGRRFEAISVAYLTQHPSRSFTLRNLGSRLPAWIESRPDLIGRRHRLAVDIARIEWAFVEAFDLGDRQPLSLAEIATLGADSRLALQPHLRLLELSYPADDLVLELHRRERRQTSEAGVRHQEESKSSPLPPVKARTTWLAAHRVDFSVYYRRLEREEFQALRAIAHGLSLSESIERGFENSRIGIRRRAQRLQSWFATWAELGWICAHSS